MNACACMGPQGNDPVCPCAMRAMGKEPSNQWTPEEIQRLHNVLSDIFGWDKLRVGDRVLVKQTAGFHKGAKGVIQYIEPSGKCWVRRDHASSDVWYAPEELEKITEETQ